MIYIMLNVSAVILGMAGSVFLFLFSVISFGRIIKNLAGQKVKNFLQYLTSTPLKGVVVGTVATSVLQSSSATSVLVASLADAGLISFYNTLGVIFGVNIGTTITSQLIAFNVMFISPFIIALGLLLHFWGRGFHKFGKPIMYFGLLFFSIYLISFFVSYVDPRSIGSFLSVTSNLTVAILVGMLASILFQSSSVVSGIVLVLAGTGNIDISQSVGLILGANIGTTSTVIIASLTMGREAKKVALAHFLFNFVGVLVLLPFINFFYVAIRWLGGDTVHQIANIYLMFNLICTVIFLLAIKPFSAIVTRIIK